MVKFSVAASALLCLMASSTTAFAPSRPLGSTAFVTSSADARVMPASAAYTNHRQSALSMNLFDRFSRVAKSNLNNILQSLEDPEKIMNQALEDMQVRKDAMR
jgi:hypothetical protein